MPSIVSALGAGAGANGIDTEDLTNQLVQAERAGKDTQLDRREDTLNAQLSAYGTLSSALSDFQDSLSALGNSDTFRSRSVTVPSSDAVTANSVEPGAQTGTYQIRVSSIAQAQSLVMGNESDSRSALGATGQLTLQLGTWSYDGANTPTSFVANPDQSALTIDVDSSDTLSTIATKINDSDLGVQANVVRTDGQYQLMVTSASGASNAIQITASDGNTGLSDFEFNVDSSVAGTGAIETQQARDAVMQVNGLTVTRQSNDIDDVIDGFSFTLNKPTEADETLTYSITADTSVARQAIEDLVDSYNTFQSQASSLTGVETNDDNTTSAGDLATDGTATSIIRQLRSVFNSTVDGLDSGYNALSMVGVRTNLDGSIELDDDAFDDAITNHFDELQGVFSEGMSSSNNYVDLAAGSSISSAQPGIYDVTVTTDPARGYLTGDAIGTADFDSASGTFNTEFQGGDDYTFQVSVNGSRSGDITLSGTYATADEMAADLQSQINGDSVLAASNTKVDVNYDSTSGGFVITSREWGSVSSVRIASASDSMAELGLTADAVSTGGIDAAGTINGEPVFGSGNVLLPNLDSGAHGLTLTVRPGAASQGAFTVNYTQGIADQMDSLISNFLDDDGAIQNREDNINRSLNDVSEQRDRLDTRMDQYRDRLTAQFQQMNEILNSMNSTSDSLDSILDVLPFTASND